jgi:hypothetical protein
MSSRSETELSQMVQLCALECVKAANPSQCLQEFTARLVAEHGWTQSDADEVAATAKGVLERVGPHIMPASGSL